MSRCFASCIFLFSFFFFPFSVFFFLFLLTFQGFRGVVDFLSFSGRVRTMTWSSCEVAVYIDGRRHFIIRRRRRIRLHSCLHMILAAKTEGAKI